MIKKLPVSALHIGMTVVAGGKEWAEFPLLYQGPAFSITCQEEINALVNRGYTEVFVDLAATDPQVLSTSMRTSMRTSDEQREKTKNRVTAPSVSLAEELPVAKQVYAESVAYARKFMTDAQQGKFDVSGAEHFLDKLMRSIERNEDALSSLSLLHYADTYTYTHCINVAVMSMSFARHRGLSSDDTYLTGLAGLFHDLGKALVPQHILNAPRKLTEEEFAIMRAHTIKGHEALQKFENVPEAVFHGALQHHEKYDGTGYPYGLADDAISVTGKLLSVVDNYDALTSRRVYKKAFFPHKALGLMFQLCNKSWEESLLHDFVRMTGVFPVGSVVLLEDGWQAIVTRCNVDNSLQPEVVAVRGPNMEQGVHHYNLAAGEGSPIAKALPQLDGGMDPLRILEAM